MEIIEMHVKYSKTIQEKQFEPVNFEAKMVVTTDSDDFSKDSINERREDWCESFAEVVNEVKKAIDIHLQKPEKYKRSRG